MTAINQKQPRFMVAHNLNRLARWLRFLGYDTVVPKSIPFFQVIERQKKEDRIYLTRDPKELHGEVKTHRVLIRAVTLNEQIKEIMPYLTFEPEYVGIRCSLCNKELKNISVEKAKELIPSFVFETHKEVRYCSFCGRFYWEGTHYHKIYTTAKSFFIK